MSKWLAGLILGIAAVAHAGSVNAEDAVRNYGSTEVAPAVAPTAAPALVARHHGRACCGGSGIAASYNAYSTYSPNPYAYYGGGANASNYRGAGAPWVYNTPNPYGYYQNGQVWGSSGPTYAAPFPVWNSPSGVYDYRYNGWGSYGWGGWGGTGPAGWGYQGGFYW